FEVAAGHRRGQGVEDVPPPEVQRLLVDRQALRTGDEAAERTGHRRGGRGGARRLGGLRRRGGRGGRHGGERQRRCAERLPAGGGHADSPGSAGPRASKAWTAVSELAPKPMVATTIPCSGSTKQYCPSAPAAMYIERGAFGTRPAAFSHQRKP